MKVLFISLPHKIEFGEKVKQVFKSPPITHLWLAANLEKDGHSVTILDALALGMDFDQIIREIENEQPQIIGFTVFTSGYHDVMFAARKIKEKFPDIKIAVGGYHVNSLPSEFYFDYIDYIFVGEAEYDFLDLANGLEAGDLKKENIKNMVFYDSKKGEWVSNEVREFRIDMDNQPLLPYEKILGNGYTTWWTNINPSSQKYMATVSGRGCALDCSFCDISKTEGLRYRCMSAERVLEEIAYMSSLGITHIEFRDPFFTADMGRVVEIAKGLIKKNLNIEWGCSSTIQKIRDPQTLKLMYDSGCRFLFFGVESGNPAILKREKKVTPEKVSNVVEMTKNAGISPHCSFIFGLEGEDESTMKETLNLALKLKPATASFSFACPYPGTAMYDSYVKKGYLTTEDWRRYDGHEPVFQTEQISKELLKKYIKKAHLGFYYRPAFLFDRLTSISSYKELATLASIGVNMLLDVTSYKR